MGVESLSTFIRSLTGAAKNNILSKFLSGPVRDFQFTEIANNGIGDALIERAFEFIETDLWTDVAVSTRYDVNPDNYVLSDQQKELASEEGFYQTIKPLTTYGPADAFQETTNVSAFEVCMGAVSQVMFTLPVGDNITGAPTTLASMEAWDPTQTSPEGHFTALESWVRKLVAHAREVSPLFWSHRIKHVASDSRVCVDFLSANGNATDVAATWPNSTASMEAHATLANSVKPGPSRGVYSSWVQKLTFDVPHSIDQEQAVFRQTNSSMWALGQVMRSCFCGWDSVQDAEGRVWCKIPPNVCSRTVAWSQRVQDICQFQSGMYWNHFEKSEDSRVVGPEMQAHIETFDRLGIW